jgi:long-chain acyl-CoA synthetase
VTTLYELFKKRESLTPNNRYLGWKATSTTPYQYITFREASVQVQELGSSLITAFGLEPAKENYVGIFARNRVEWVLTQLACEHYSLVSVPLYDTLGEEAISFILLQTGVTVVVCDDSAKALHLMGHKSSLKSIIVIDAISEEVRAKAAELGISVFSFDSAKEIGRKNPKKPVPPKSDDITTICYTSGTTGTPKGAMITHKNIVVIVTTMMHYLHGSGRVKDGEEAHISYLPLAHMFERAVQATMLGLGARIGFFQGDVRKLVDDIKEVKPTIFCTVPRLLNRIYGKINEQIESSSSVKKALFKWAFSHKEKEILS